MKNSSNKKDVMASDDANINNVNEKYNNKNNKNNMNNVNEDELKGVHKGMGFFKQFFYSTIGIRKVHKLNSKDTNHKLFLSTVHIILMILSVIIMSSHLYFFLKEYEVHDALFGIEFSRLATMGYILLLVFTFIVLLLSKYIYIFIGNLKVDSLLEESKSNFSKKEQEKIVTYSVAPNLIGLSMLIVIIYNNILTPFMNGTGIFLIVFFVFILWKTVNYVFAKFDSKGERYKKLTVKESLEVFFKQLYYSTFGILNIHKINKPIYNSGIFRFIVITLIAVLYFISLAIIKFNSYNTSYDPTPFDFVILWLLFIVIIPFAFKGIGNLILKLMNRRKNYNNAISLDDEDERVINYSMVSPFIILLTFLYIQFKLKGIENVHAVDIVKTSFISLIIYIVLVIYTYIKFVKNHEFIKDKKPNNVDSNINVNENLNYNKSHLDLSLKEQKLNYTENKEKLGFFKHLYYSTIGISKVYKLNKPEIEHNRFLKKVFGILLVIFVVSCLIPLFIMKLDGIASLYLVVFPPIIFLAIIMCRYIFKYMAKKRVNKLIIRHNSDITKEMVGKISTYSTIPLLTLWVMILSVAMIIPNIMLVLLNPLPIIITVVLQFLITNYVFKKFDENLGEDTKRKAISFKESFNIFMKQLYYSTIGLKKVHVLNNDKYNSEKFKHIFIVFILAIVHILSFIDANVSYNNAFFYAINLAVGLFLYLIITTYILKILVKYIVKFKNKNKNNDRRLGIREELRAMDYSVILTSSLAPIIIYIIFGFKTFNNYPFLINMFKNLVIISIIYIFVVSFVSTIFINNKKVNDNTLERQKGKKNKKKLKLNRLDKNGKYKNSDNY